jgi:hypothetical protein
MNASDDLVHEFSMNKNEACTPTVKPRSLPAANFLRKPANCRQCAAVKLPDEQK